MPGRVAETAEPSSPSVGSSLENDFNTESTLTDSETSAPFTDLSEQDRAQILAWNGNPVLEVRSCIHEIFQERVSLHADKEAVCCEDGTYTYSELESLSSRLSHYISTLGVGVGDFVPLYFDKSVWNVISMLAVMKSGAAFVPFDPTFPTTRTTSLVKSINAKVSSLETPVDTL